MIIYLEVPYAEKDKAKALGAWWSPSKKKWYVKDIENLYPFYKWIPAYLKRPCKPVLH